MDSDTHSVAPVLYVSDLTTERFDPADLFDLAFLLRSPNHDLQGIIVQDTEKAAPLLDQLTETAKREVRYFAAADGLTIALREAVAPVSVVVVGGYSIVADVLASDRALFRQKVARLFVVGGHINRYSDRPDERIERLPIDPRLRERNPERFDIIGDPRSLNVEPLGELLTSGEGVIYLPRDICLWRYAAPGLLAGGGPVCEFLLREVFFAALPDHPGDHLAAADAPVLLSTLPALLLAAAPDTSMWLRLFRALPARLTTDEYGITTDLVTKAENPNLYLVIAIDGQSLGRRLTEQLRDRPLLP